MVNKKLVAFSSLVFLMSPLTIWALAMPAGLPGAGFDIVKAIDNIIAFIWVIFGGIAIIMFIYAGFLFLLAKGDMSAVKEARNALVWGMVGVGVALFAAIIPWFVRAILGIT